MEAKFYDVKLKKSVTAKVIEKKAYGNRYAFKGKTSDGRNLTVFVGKDAFDKAKI